MTNRPPCMYLVWSSSNMYAYQHISMQHIYNQIDKIRIKIVCRYVCCVDTFIYALCTYDCVAAWGHVPCTMHPEICHFWKLAQSLLSAKQTWTPWCCSSVSPFVSMLKMMTGWQDANMSGRLDETGWDRMRMFSQNVKDMRVMSGLSCFTRLK